MTADWVGTVDEGCWSWSDPSTGPTLVDPDRIGWWGGPDTRPRCPLDGKVVKPDREAAERRAAEIRTARRLPGDERMQAYCCGVGNWHVGHGRRRGR